MLLGGANASANKYGVRNEAPCLGETYGSIYFEGLNSPHMILYRSCSKAVEGSGKVGRHSHMRTRNIGNHSVLLYMVYHSTS